MFVKKLLALFCLFSVLCSTSTFAQKFSEDDIFSLEYATHPVFHPNKPLIIYVRQHMDKQLDKKISTIWQVNLDGSGHKPFPTISGISHSPVFSPSGEKLAYVATFKGETNAYVYTLANGKNKKVIGTTGGVSNIAWSRDEKSIAFNRFVSLPSPVFSQKENMPAGATWAKNATFIENEVYRADGKGYLKNGFKQIFITKLEQQETKQITDVPFDHHSKISWSMDNRALYFSASLAGKNELQPADTNIFSVDINSKQVKQLTSRFGHENNPALSPDGKWLAYTGFAQEYKGYHVQDIYLLELASLKTTVLTKAFDRSISNIQWSANSKRLYFQYDDKGNTFIASTDLVGKRKIIAKDVGGTAFGRPYSGGSFSINDKERIAFTYGPVENMANIAIVEKGQAQPLTHLNEDLFASRSLANVEEVNYKSSIDGRNIQGWVVKPAGFDANKKYPLILEIHGGPFTNYGARFSAEAQLMSSAGYVVLYTNPRGSTSYGQEFADLIHHKFPADGYHDLLSGVDHLIGQGYIDDKKLFVTGGSAGGTLTSWLIGKTDRFAAAVVVKPVINWTSQVMYSDIGEYIAKHWFGKTPWQAPTEYWQRSPLSLVPNVKTPTMLLTGEVDYRTPMAETEQYYQALKMNGVETVMVRIPEASHGITSRPSNLITKVDHVIKWFDRYAK